MHIRSSVGAELRLITFLVTTLLTVCSTNAATAAPSFSVHIDDMPAMVNNGAVFARYGQRIELDLIDCPFSNIRWYLLIPKPLDYNNVSYCQYKKNCIQPIEYQSKELDSVKGSKKLVLSSIPELALIGTHEIQARIDGIEIKVQVVIRRDDSYIGYATELLGVPFVYAPGYQVEGHQTDLRKGADCVALIIYARRRQGDLIPYSAPPKLYDYTIKIGDKLNISQKMIKEGDILHFGFQTALVARHRSQKKGISDDDLIIHTYHGVAEIVTYSQLPYRDAFFDVLRWRGKSATNENQ